MQCTACGAPVATGAMHCGACGAPAPRTTPAAALATRQRHPHRAVRHLELRRPGGGRCACAGGGATPRHGCHSPPGLPAYRPTAAARAPPARLPVGACADGRRAGAGGWRGARATCVWLTPPQRRTGENWLARAYPANAGAHRRPGLCARASGPRRGRRAGPRADGDGGARCRPAGLPARQQCRDLRAGAGGVPDV